MLLLSNIGRFLIFTLVANYNHNNGYFAGVAPILFDPELRASYQEDCAKMGRLYFRKLSSVIEGWKHHRVDEGKRILENLVTTFEL